MTCRDKRQFGLEAVTMATSVKDVVLGGLFATNHLALTRLT